MLAVLLLSAAPTSFVVQPAAFGVRQEPRSLMMAEKPVSEVFSQAASEMGRLGAYVTVREDLVTAFNGEMDKDETIGAEEMAAILSQLGEDPSEERVAELMAAANVAADGRLRFEPWCKAFCDLAVEARSGGQEKKFFGLF